MEKAKILYIEDEPDYQRLVSDMLRETGLTVRVAESGKTGLRLLERENPRLLLLDIHLPDTNGFSLCRQLRQETAWKDLPILMLTVLRRPEEWRNGFFCGATDYVSKPLNPPEFLERVEACLKGKAVRPMIVEDDAEYQMIQAALAGNRGALEVLIKQYKTPLLRTMTQLVGNRVEAEDIVSTALLIALERLKEFRGQSSFCTWLYGIALNQLHSRWRERACFPMQSASAMRDEDWPADQGTPFGQMERKLDLARVQKAISLVPRPYRTALTWNLVRGLSYSAIASRWGVPEGTVFSRMAVAKRLLRIAWDRVAPTPKDVP